MILSSIRGVSSTRLPGEVPLLLPISHPPLDLEDYVNLIHKARNLHQGSGRVNRNFPASPNGIPGARFAYLPASFGLPLGSSAMGPFTPAGSRTAGLPAGPAAGDTGLLTST